MAVLSKPDKMVRILCEFCHQIIELLHLSMTWWWEICSRY